MALLERIVERAKANRKTIILPEGDDKRTIDAAVKCRDEGVADIILLGDEAEINANAAGADLSGIKIINPLTSELFDGFVSQYTEMRKAKGMTEEKAREELKDSVYFGCMMLYNDMADGLVSGAVHATSDLLRPALKIIKTAPGISTVSSYFLMEFPTKELGDNGVLIYADCGVVIDPNEEELAAIAIASYNSAKTIAELDPKVAMLSFSTKGSASHPLADKMINATKKVQEMRPDIVIDGELQGDAALVESVGNKKAPGSPVAGKANVLIFPNIDAGNIAYKRTQRLAGATAVGPICQGFKKPVNDLSRGCNSDDIVYAVAITVLQSLS
ncbi:MAG: phosphate acetyltransferase [Clostridia bacterium]|nr:phosphate acetyltransferase [Clostridia bacterium]